MKTNEIFLGDVRDIAKTLPDRSVNSIMTSPPYFGLRDYQTGTWQGGDEGCDHKPGSLSRAAGSTLSGGHNHGGHLLEGYRHVCSKCGAIRIDKQLGLEETPGEYTDNLVTVFRELRRVLRDDGTVWLNLGDSYAGSGNKTGEGETRNLKTDKFHGGKAHLEQRRTTGDHGLKPKNLVGIPWRVALALQADGWYLRSDIIWQKKNPIPESCRDRPTKAHEYIFLLTKSAKYWYDQDAVREAYQESSIQRVNQKNFDNQTGGPKDYRNGINKNRSMRQTVENFKNTKNAGRNRRTVWAAPSPQDPLLSYLLDKLTTDDPERLQDYLEQYATDQTNKGDVFTVSTKPYKAAHFACFPPDLIRPCIRAGCPPKVCVECGEPWVRMVEKEVDNTGYPNGPGGRHKEYERQTGSLSSVARWNVKTIGFTPACQCNAPTRPGIVLDPFIGSGTTAAVAIEEKRNWLGIELNPEYIELAKERIYKTQPALFAR